MRPSVAPSEKPAGSKKPSGADIPGISSHENEGGLGGASSTLASSSSKLLLSSISGGREQRSSDDGLSDDGLSDDGLSDDGWSCIVVKRWIIFGADINCRISLFSSPRYMYHVTWICRDPRLDPNQHSLDHM